jgi:solute carrier family 41
VSQIFILVPALLGLKGNLDMCLASRLSTQANLGNMTCYREVLKMIIGNIALVQVQAIVAALLVAIFATIVGTITNGNVSWNHSLLLITSSICTATSSCFILGKMLYIVETFIKTLGCTCAFSNVAHFLKLSCYLSQRR